MGRTSKERMHMQQILKIYPEYMIEKLAKASMRSHLKAHQPMNSAPSNAGKFGMQVRNSVHVRAARIKH
jgi:hypothetical protein